MKYVCLGYMDEKKWDTLLKSEQQAMMEECFAYDDVLRKDGHFLGGEALQSVRNAATLRWQGDKVSVTDGPYAETKEQLGGILLPSWPLFFFRWARIRCCMCSTSIHPGANRCPTRRTTFWRWPIAAFTASWAATLLRASRLAIPCGTR